MSLSGWTLLNGWALLSEEQFLVKFMDLWILEYLVRRMLFWNQEKVTIIHLKNMRRDVEWTPNNNLLNTAWLKAMHLSYDMKPGRTKVLILPKVQDFNPLVPNYPDFGFFPHNKLSCLLGNRKAVLACQWLGRLILLAKERFRSWQWLIALLVQDGGKIVVNCNVQGFRRSCPHWVSLLNACVLDDVGISCMRFIIVFSAVLKSLGGQYVRS